MRIFMTHPILLIEDTASLQMMYAAIVRKAGFEVDTALTAAEGARSFAAKRHRIVLLDLMLPDGDGQELLAEFLAREPDTKVIVITANGSINHAVSAMRAGAFDFLVKPFDDQRLLSGVNNALAALGATPRRAARMDKAGFEGFIGTSAKMQAVYDKIASIGQSMATVFITGESGTGKEVCAQAIHAMSNRATEPFIALNCGAIPRDLLESEVFGHLKGSFTGAISDKIGAAAAANGGTLFLDEICEMDISLQTKLLRFLETSTIQPVGSVRPTKIDVRIICATNRKPEVEVAEGRFREDLFYRLHVVPIDLPPLHERGGDAVEIAQSALEKFAVEEGKKFKRLSADVARVFAAHPWPGNVRQLLNVLRNAVVLNDGEVVELSMLPPEFLAALNTQARTPTATPLAAAEATSAVQDVGSAIDALLGTKMSLAEIERLLIEAAISNFKGSVPRAARQLDLSPSTVYRKRETWLKSDTSEDL